SPDVVSYSRRGAGLDEAMSAFPDVVSTWTRPAASPTRTLPLTAWTRTSAALSTLIFPPTASTSTSPNVPASLTLPLVVDTSTAEFAGTEILIGPRQLPGQSTSTSTSSSSVDSDTPPPSHVALTSFTFPAVMSKLSFIDSACRRTGPVTFTGAGLV